MFDDEVLQSHIRTFWGYGNYTAAYWFVGMEHGGGSSREEIERRLNAWHQRGRKELEDLVDYHHAIGVTHFFGTHPKIQATWGKLARIYLSAKGLEPSAEDVRSYQATSLARSDTDSSLMELLPLPSPKASDWLHYATLSQLPYLRNRESYERHVVPARVRHIRRRIDEYRPKVVVFYGVGFQQRWQQIARVPFRPGHPDGVQVGHDGHTLFVITKHPVARGLRSHYFHEVGRMIALRIRR